MGESRTRSSLEQFTAQYFDAVETRLHVKDVDVGRPTLFDAEVNPISIQMLKGDLHDLRRSQLFGGAVSDLQHPPSECIQTTAIGLAEDFHQLVKLGFLFGDRVVLWDTVMLGALAGPEHRVDKAALFRVASDLLALKPLVSMGAIAYLPHPGLWLDEARRNLEYAAYAPQRSSALQGYLTAQALLEAAFPLHPYMFSADTVPREDHNLALGGQPDRYQSERRLLHCTASSLLADERLIYLQEISPVRFYEVLRACGTVAADLQEELTRYAPGMSDEEKRKRLAEQHEKLVGRLTSRDRAIGRLVRSGALTAGVLGVVGALVTLATAGTPAGAAAGGLGFARATIAFLAERLKAQKEPALYQFFYKLEQAAERQRVEDALDDRHFGHPGIGACPM